MAPSVSIERGELFKEFLDSAQRFLEFDFDTLEGIQQLIIALGVETWLLFDSGAEVHSLPPDCETDYPFRDDVETLDSCLWQVL